MGWREILKLLQEWIGDDDDADGCGACLDYRE